MKLISFSFFFVTIESILTSLPELDLIEPTELDLIEPTIIIITELKLREPTELYLIEPTELKLRESPLSVKRNRKPTYTKNSYHKELERWAQGLKIQKVRSIGSSQDCTFKAVQEI